MPEFPKLTKKEACVLGLLINGDEKYGLELVRESCGELKRGTVYVLLEYMGAKGYIESREEIGPTLGWIPRRRLYRTTSLGEMAYRFWDRHHR